MFSRLTPRAGACAPSLRFRPALESLAQRELPSAVPVGHPADLTPRQGHVMGYDSLGQPGPQDGSSGIWVSFILKAGDAAASRPPVSDGPMPQSIGSFFDIFTEEW